MIKLRKKQLTEKQKRPFYINLPKGAKSPTNSIYKQFDIVTQGMALWSTENGRLIRSAKPFVLLVLVGKKTKILASKVE